MKDIKLTKKKRAVVIVAHPDDETIWMGGTILLNPYLDWLVYSICRASDNDRKPKFFRVCHQLKVKGMIDDFDDDGNIDLLKSVLPIKKLITKRLGTEKIDYLFTHGQNGEYGHVRHLGVNYAVKQLLKDGMLQPKAVFYFNYKKNLKDRYPLMIPKKDSDFLIKLPRKIYQQKRKIVAEMYGYPYDGVDVNYCVNEEAFKIKTNIKI